MSQIIVKDADTWAIQGELSFATVNPLLAEFTALSSTRTLPKVLELGEVTHTDSAGLAFLIELLKQTATKPVIFHAVPAQMLRMATISGVQTLLTHSTV